MAMPHLAQRYTAQDVLSFPEDGNRYELVRGELLVSPAPRPRHQLVIQALADILGAYLVAEGRTHTLVLSPADISWDAETLVQPDLFVVPSLEVSDDWSTFRTLPLAVEVLSPRTARADRIVKRDLYARQGVATYWIVDHEAGVVEVWHPRDVRPEIVTRTLHWRVTNEAADCTLEIDQFLAHLPASGE